jgi:hypothetical protein
MNTNMKRTLMALAVTALFGASTAYAHDDGNSNGGNSVTIKKHISLSSDVKISGDPTVSGAMSINSAAIALEDGSQSTQGNWVINAAGTSNNSSISGNVGQGSSGNVGANVAAGDDNSQANAAALATSVSGSSSGSSVTADCHTGCSGGGSSSDGEMADAEAFADQSVAFNVTANFGTSNNASVSGNAFDGASGNIGVNVASGDDNEQLNGLAASTTDDNVYSTATASTNQQSQGNVTLNGPYCDTSTSNNASLSGNAFEGASGNIGVNVAAGTGNMQANTLAVAAATK